VAGNRVRVLHEIQNGRLRRNGSATGASRLHRCRRMVRRPDFPEPYRTRRHAGEELARHLTHLKGQDVVVLALPRGGVPVAFEVARGLDAPLDVFVVRKLGMPGHPEFAMGAIASGGVRVLNDEVVRLYRIPQQVVDAIATEEHTELERRERAYRHYRPALEVRGRTVVLIDDGLATGSTMKAAVEAVRALGPARIIVAVPVGSPDTCREFATIADDIVCARAPEDFAAVGQWYDDFRQTTDEEVRELLHAASSEPAGKPR
jgi:putative phosphoribosyl transferase